MHIKSLMPGLMLSAALLIPSAAFSSSLTILNPDFAVPAIACSLNYAYQGSGNCSSTGGGGPFPQEDFNGSAGFGWTLANGAGLTGALSNFQPPSFSGLPFTQAVFLQGNNSTVSQTISGFNVGQSYVLNFYLGSRFNNTNDGNQTVQALLNGNVVGTWVLSSFTPFTLQGVTITGTSGSETLQFMGLANHDSTAFLSHVSISSVPEPSSLELLIFGGALLGFFLRSSRSRV